MIIDCHADLEPHKMRLLGLFREEEMLVLGKTFCGSFL